VHDDAPTLPPLPEHPELREIALAMEGAGISGELLDANWQIVFISSEEARIVGVPVEEVATFYGKSLVTRQLDDAEHWGITPDVSRSWWRLNVPIMRKYLAPADGIFEKVFGPLAENAARVDPVEDTPRAWQHSYEFPAERRLRQTWLGDITFLDLRIDDGAGQFIGVLRLARAAIPDSLLARLGRGDRGLFERMDAVREPARRPAAILFADLGGSSALSRRLSSRGYFDLIGEVTGLIDTAVIARRGIVGKHAGDGGSALFLVGDFDGSESAAARAAIEAARAIREGAAGLCSGSVSVQLNIGLHWGSTLMVGQVATTGRLEVTALGDQMNEGARIEAAAREGAILASKDLIERLDSEDARDAGVDLAAIAYTPLGELDGSSESTVREAGAIPVTPI
jgi:class 3 adenylate cyclase